jgi:predicted anti-sigma-YlaC factor YlaD
MNHISHEQARSFLQAEADQLLDSERRALLESHLASCEDCRIYARELDNLENALRSAMQARWNASRIRLPMDGILGRRTASERLTLQRVLRFSGASLLAIAVIAFAVFLGFGNFSPDRDASTPQATVSMAAIPTPSIQRTASRVAATDCDPLVYKVQAGDTLESIARKFSVAKERIMEVNNLKSEELSGLSQLLIPQCGPIPSHTPTTTLTYTVTPFSVNASRTP